MVARTLCLAGKKKSAGLPERGCQGPWLSMHAGGSDSSEHRWGCKPSMATAKPDSHQSSRGPDEGPMIDVLRYITDMNMPYKECISGYL